MRDTIIERVLDAVRDGQVLPDATVRTWQASPSGKYHAANTCRDRALPVIVDHRALDLDGLATAEEDRFCRHCPNGDWNQPNPWRDWLAVSDAVAAADRWLAPCDEDGFDLRRVTRLLGSLRRFAERTDPILADAARERARLLAERIAVHLATVAPGTAARYAAIEQLCHNLPRPWRLPIPTDGRHRPDGTVDAYVCPPVAGAHSTVTEPHPAHRAAWAAFADAINTGATSTTAIAAATRAATAAVADLTAPWERIPATTRFPAADFTHPLDWANAEWRAAAVDECHDLAAGWADIADVAAARPDVTIVFTGFDPTGDANPACDAAVRLIRPTEIAVAGNVAFANVPAAVVDWLTVLASEASWQPPRRSDPAIVVIANDSTPIEVLQVAAAVFDPDGGDLASPHQALQAAHHLTVR